LRILFDQGVPVPLRDHLRNHEVRTAYELGWSALRNGELLTRAAAQFDALVTTDRNLKSQQNLSQVKIAILVLPTTSWPQLQSMLGDIVAAVDVLRTAEYRELPLRSP
jgi:hypothetical protein